MNEFENDIQSDTIDVDAVSDKKFVHIDKSKRIFDIVYLALCSAFMLVMWCTGYNFLPLIANVLAIVAGVLIFARVLAKSNVGLYMWIAYMVCICGLFVFFLIWGAESFGKTFGTIWCLCSSPCCLPRWFMCPTSLSQRKPLSKSLARYALSLW